MHFINFYKYKSRYSIHKRKEGTINFTLTVAKCTNYTIITYYDFKIFFILCCPVVYLAIN